MALSERGRGSLTSSEDRKKIIELITEAVGSGCRLFRACEAFGLEERTIQRWKTNTADRRHGPLATPANKLTESERELIIRTSVKPEFVNLSPHQIVPKLADVGIYIASESTFYRILKSEKLNAHRGLSKPRMIEKPKPFESTKPNQIYSWDITYLQGSVRGQFYYLYLFLDIFSRKIVGWQVHEHQSADVAANLLADICLREKINKNSLVLHSDNGGPMKGATMLATMQKLGVIPSFSRPSVSDDNPYSESLFKTLKYCPEYPSKPFEDIESANKWVNKFVNWYNTMHLHSSINFVTPESKHERRDVEILKNRNEVYKTAKNKNPNRWSKETRNWNVVQVVKLNPLKEKNNSSTCKELQQAC